MRNFKRKASAIILSTLFASMQVTYAVMDTGLGAGNGGAIINSTQGGFVNLNKGQNSATLNFNGNSHVKWDTLNVNANEKLNFNAVNGTSGLTVLNTVNKGMSNIYGQVNANDGISKLIISNPNGVFFDGARFTTTGDAMVTTKDLSGVALNDLNKIDMNTGAFTNLYDENGKIVTVKIQDSDFNVGGEYNIVAPGINAATSKLSAKAVKLVTANGQDYLAVSKNAPTKDQTVTKLKTVDVDGDLYITNDVGALNIVDGGTINGNVKTITNGSVVVNRENHGKQFVVNGDAELKGNGGQMFFRNAKVDGNLDLANGGGFLDLANSEITGNAKLLTKNVSTNNFNCAPVKHFTHVVGETKVGGDLTIDSKDNIHIGGYDYDKQALMDGNLKVGGNLTAHSQDGHVMTTIDTSANKISYKADNLNILTDGKATLTAKEYEFSSNGYIGGLKTTDAMSVDSKVVNIMENYIYIPDTVGTPGYVNIAGGKISKIDTPAGASTYIASKGDVLLTGANAGTVNITAPDKYIEITGPDVHANTIFVGKETNKVKVDFPNRDFDLKYTNIRDEKLTVVDKNEEITYELTNDKNGYNDGTQIAGKSTYLVGPEKTPVVTPPDEPTPPPVQPEPDPDPINPDDNENVKVLRSYENRSIDMAQVYAPVAYAADLDDEDVDTAVRKNVDGSVTVVRAFPMTN